MPWPLSAVNSGPRRLSQAHGITETCRNSQPTCSAASCSSPADRPDVQSQAQCLSGNISERKLAFSGCEQSLVPEGDLSRWRLRRLKNPMISRSGFRTDTHCHIVIKSGLRPDADEYTCPSCFREVFLTDMIGFHLDMDEESAPESVASSYML